MEPIEDKVVPSWQRWPPNCCETCTGWRRIDQFTGICDQGATHCNTTTDSRFRCQDFTRKPEGKPEQ